jgi:thiol-disulfide isomerase/thioredoxin
MRLISAACLIALATPAHAGVLQKGDKLAELDVAQDSGGKPFKLRSLAGKWVLVTVGAAWCKPCKKELPTWDKLAGILKDKITFVAIAVDDDVKDGKKFHADLKLKNMKLVYMPADKSAVSARYGADTMPSSFVADPKQVIRLRKDGFEERDSDGELKKMHAEINKLVAP